MNPVLRELGGYPLASFQDLKAELAADGQPLFDFSIGDPIEPTPTFIRDALVAAVPEVSQYPTASGLRSLREAVAGWVGRRFGVTVDPDRHVLPTAGSKEAIFHLPLGIVDPRGSRRTVVWGEPGYLVYERGMRFAGGGSDPVPLGAPGGAPGAQSGWRLDLAALPPERRQATAIAWLNYPHNPTGATVDVGYLRSQLEVARAEGIVLASDECYADIYPPHGTPPPSLLQAAGTPGDPDLSGLLVAFSLSKRSGMTGYRSGALVGDPELIAIQRTLRPNIGTASPEFVQHAATAAWADDAHAAERREVFAAKRAVVLEFLRAQGLEVSGSEATFYLWFAAPEGDDTAYAEALLRHRIVASPGRAFGPSGAGWLRLALVPDVAGCHAAVERWQQAIAAGDLPGHR
ncbi:aminotransferase class I/II-fold pyridoxal phosphate-dependent enzyme [Egibacter rhizosphaerae]|uniref:Aminotransferase class I/II-fold pyridoxal phosphate-dependent enzyme n=1 Tax=Egibacter rhizosphaerae TaxID=1670831 RepID=A0A411YKA6_9ACTN|nr:aminotransferase class I/II-fold pyridoxal phosphate-dependent enzyme [Egibacter rhizosphaerae]QBI21625.1 aminotransferase class I/II-fold pyridoxal phosphate-dependent enzyme [Egibacter rhizosphaerae]